MTKTNEKIADLSKELQDLAARGFSLEEVKLAYVMAAFASANKNITHTSKNIKIGLRTAQRLITKTGFDRLGLVEEKRAQKA
jgi:hypothetical protein